MDILFTLVFIPAFVAGFFCLFTGRGENLLILVFLSTTFWAPLTYKLMRDYSKNRTNFYKVSSTPVSDYRKVGSSYILKGGETVVFPVDIPGRLHIVEEVGKVEFGFPKKVKRYSYEIRE